MNILLAAHYFPPHVGGIEQVVRHEAEGLTARGHDVTVLTTTAEPGGRCERVPAGSTAGYDVVRLPAWAPLESHGVPFPLVIPGTATRRLLRGLPRPDVVHAHDLSYPTTWIADRIAARAGVPLVLTQHVSQVEHPSRLVRGSQRAVYAATRGVAHRAALLIHLNTTVGRFLAEQAGDASRLAFLPNGVDDDLFHPAAGQGERDRLRRAYRLPEGFLAVFVGRLVPKKGYNVVLDALAGSAAPGGADGAGGTGRACAVAFIGGPVPPGHARAVPGRAIHLGERRPDEVADIYRAADAFVLPSRSEGFPLTVQEALASGLPVVTTDDEGYRPYALDRSGAAILLEPTPAAVRAALTRLAADPARCAEMAFAARRYAVAAFSWERHVEQLEAHYLRVCGAEHRRTGVEHRRSEAGHRRTDRRSEAGHPRSEAESRRPKAVSS